MKGDPFSEKYWAGVWSRVRKSSFLYQSQKNEPARWLAFYNNVGDIWQEMSGDGQTLVADKIVDFFIREQLAKPGDSLLEVGCGPGALSLAFAQQGLSVTALDSSAEMVAVCRSEAERRGLSHLKVVQSDWCSHQPNPPAHLVLASSFPQALNPKGIRQLERLATGHCGLLLGCGTDALPFRRRLWKIVMDVPIKTSYTHLTCTINYLLATGRHASLHRFSVPVCLHLPAASIIRYFQCYFAIFGKTDTEVLTRIEAAVTPFSRDGYLDFSGTLDSALIWWPVLADPEP